MDSWDDAPCGLLRIDHRGIVQTVNARVLARTGYLREDVVGRASWTQILTAGSRLFYESQLAPVLELDGALEEIMLDLQGADGRRLPALVSATVIRDESGRTAGARIAVLTVPDRHRYEEDLRTAQREAEQATVASGSVRRRLELLAQANAALASSVDVGIALRRLAELLVRHLGDWCLIYATDDSDPDQPPQWAGVHIRADQQPALERLAELLPAHSSPGSALSDVLDSGTAVLLEAVSEEHKLASTGSPDVLDLYEALGLSSALIVPSTARGFRVATIILVRGGDRDPFTAEDLADPTDLGARTGIVIDNVRRFAREHRASVALQQALLTTPPATPKMQIATRYLPATDGAEVGGDWYDAFLLRDQTPVLVIGDVVGHDIHAAACMGQLRGIIRALAYAQEGSPAQVLTAADDAARGLHVSTLASAIVARFRSADTPGRAILTWSNAGHLAPILITAGGDILHLHAPANLILGVNPSSARTDQTMHVSTGDTILLYTDGLIERPGEDLDTGTARLTARLRDAHLHTLDQVCDAALAEHAAQRRDDIALLGIRVLGDW